MKEELFTKKSLEKIKSPDSLNDTIKVLSPGVWLLLSAIIVLLVGAVLWGIFGRIENKFTVSAEVKNEVAVCSLDYDQYSQVETGMKVRIGNVEGVISSTDKKTGKITVDISVPDGLYTSEIITESIKPFSFVTN